MRRDQNLWLGEMQLAGPAAAQDAVLALHHKVARRLRRTQRPCRDQHRSQLWIVPHLLAGHGATANPADRLRPVIHGQDQITGAKILNPAAAQRRAYQRACGKADQKADIVDDRTEAVVRARLGKADAVGVGESTRVQRHRWRERLRGIKIGKASLELNDGAAAVQDINAKPFARRCHRRCR